MSACLNSGFFNEDIWGSYSTKWNRSWKLEAHIDGYTTIYLFGTAQTLYEVIHIRPIEKNNTFKPSMNFQFDLIQICSSYNLVLQCVNNLNN